MQFQRKCCSKEGPGEGQGALLAKIQEDLPESHQSQGLLTEEGGGLSALAPDSAALSQVSQVLDADN